MEEEEEFTCDSMQPSIPPAIKVYPDFEPYFPLPRESGAWEDIFDANDLPQVDHLAEMLSPNDMFPSEVSWQAMSKPLPETSTTWASPHWLNTVSCS